jgi:DNA recombination protein RmuC
MNFFPPAYLEIWLAAVAAGICMCLILVGAWVRARRRYMEVRREHETLTRAYQELEHGEREARQDMQVLEEKLQATHAQLVRAETRLEEQQHYMQEKEEFLRQTRESMQVQFKTLAQEIFEEKGRSFKHENKSGLNEILDPLRSQLQEFRQRIDTIHVTDLKDRTSIRHELEHLRTTSHQLNQEAVNLTRALKGENKFQGNWGEMVLERVLEQSGLRKGYEYDTQVHLRNEENKLLRPDVVVHLPEGKEIVIDSKVSLTAYERYCSAEDTAEQELALKQHVSAVRQHITSLGSKDYADLKGVESLDFILMFMPLEPAFICAVQHAEDLLELSMQQHVVVVTPTTLLATMRTVENIWRFERQNQNAHAIAERAGAVYDKLRGFVEDMEKIGTQITTLDQQYHSAMNKLTQGRGNLISQASRFVDLGVKVKKKIPAGVVERSEIETDTGSDV